MHITAKISGCFDQHAGVVTSVATYCLVMTTSYIYTFREMCIWYSLMNCLCIFQETVVYHISHGQSHM